MGAVIERGRVRRGTPEWVRLRRQLQASPGRRKSASSAGTKTDHAEDALVILQRAELAEGFEREIKFHPTRDWRFDLAREDLMIAVEIEGLNRFSPHPGAHRSVEGFTEDRLKYAEATAMGWAVLSFTTGQMNDGTMERLVRKTIKLRTEGGLDA